MKKVSCKPLSFVPEVSNYSRGIFLFRKVRSFYSLLSIYSEGIFVLTKKVSRKPLSFVPEVSINSRTEEIDAFLKKHRYTKVKLIEEGYKALLEQAGEIDTDLAKIIDGYDDFFESELKQFEEEKKKFADETEQAE